MTKTTTRPSTPPRSGPNGSVLLIAGGALVLLVIIGLAVALLAGGDDGADGADAPGGSDRAEATFGPVTVEGTALTGFDGAEDPAVGQAAPVLSVTSPEGRDFTIGGDGQPTLVTFLAHWCPHCQAELPLLVDLQDAGAFQGVRTVAVLTGTSADAPNYPPVPWLDEEGWTGEIALDDEAATAASAYGLTSYPFLVMLDADGAVTGRLAGEQPPEVVEELVATAAG